jgi:hypothetical protein
LWEDGPNAAKVVLALGNFPPGDPKLQFLRYISVNEKSDFYTAVMPAGPGPTGDPKTERSGDKDL